MTSPPSLSLGGEGSQGVVLSVVKAEVLIKLKFNYNVKAGNCGLEEVYLIFLLIVLYAFFTADFQLPRTFILFRFH